MEWGQESGMKTWKETVDELKQMIPEICPQWTNYNLHDPGITLLELMAWLSQNQIYRIRQIGREHRRDYLKLLGIKLVKKQPGRTLVTVQSKASLKLVAGTRFYAGDIPFETRVEQMVTEGAFLRFVAGAGNETECLSGDWLKEGRGVSIYPFGHSPKPGNWMEIHLGRPLKAGEIHRLYMEFLQPEKARRIPVDESAFDGHGFYPLADIRMEYMSLDGWRLVENGSGRAGNRMEDGTYGMIQNGSLIFSFDKTMGADCRLRFTLLRSDYVQPPCITRISLAMAEVWQQETALKEELPSFMGDGFPNQRFLLEDEDIWDEEFQLEAQVPVIVQDTGEEAWVMERWEQVEDFHCSGPQDMHYRLDKGTLIFGDGIHGMMPEACIQVVRLKRTLGGRGNIKSGTIDRMGHILAGSGEAVITHEMDVTGGLDAETEEEALEQFSRQQEEDSARPLYRAVTLRDYEKLAMQVPGLLIEACRAYVLHPDLNEVILAVKPHSASAKSVLTPGYQKNLYRFLEEKRMLGTKIRIVSPDYYDVTIVCMVCAKVQYRMAAQMVEEAVTQWIEALGFGQGISYGELLGMIDALPCVQRAGSLWLDAGSRGKRNSRGDLHLPPNGLIHLKKITCNLTAPEREHL